MEQITGTGILQTNASGDLMLDRPLTRKEFAMMLYLYEQKRK